MKFIPPQYFKVLISMNLKHEMFWNVEMTGMDFLVGGMNLKHEMFWNITATGDKVTVN